MDTIGARIRAARGRARLTQKELADRLGVSVTTVKTWEGDHNLPLRARLDAIEHVLRVQLHDSPTTDDPRVDEASHPRLLAELAARDADSQDRIRALEAENNELRAQLAALRGDIPSGRMSRPRLVQAPREVEPQRLVGRRLDDHPAPEAQPDTGPDTNGTGVDGENP